MSALRSIFRISIVLVFALFAALASAQQRPPYGPEVMLDNAKKLAAAAVAEAKKNNWNVAVAIVDNHGSLIYYERMDDTQSASSVIAVDKARSAAMFRRTTREMQETSTKATRRLWAYTTRRPSPADYRSYLAGKSSAASA